jgi:predicted lipoprotein
MPVLSAPVDHAAIRERAIGVLVRQFGTFRAATTTLENVAVDHCDGMVPQAKLEYAVAAAWSAWAPLDSYQFGPIEQTGAALSVDFWPDKKDFVGRGLDALLALPEAEQARVDGVATVSAAAQGLPALERLLATDLPVCPAAIGISAHLQATADAIYQGWFAADGWAQLMRTAGPENPVYLSDGEVSRTFFTAVDFGLERVADTRIGRPLGSYERSYPRRAEGWRLGLSASIAAAQIEALADLVDEAFGPALAPETAAHFRSVAQAAHDRLTAIEPPLHEAVADGMGHLRVEAVQTRVQQLRQILAEDIGPELGLETGFSAADGD